MPEIDISCPFCGLVCDDLRVAGEAVGAPACARAVRLFAVPAHGQALLAGQPVAPETAYRAAAALLMRARRPLIGGLACDVTGHRAALALAERVGGVVEHMNGAAQFRNWLALQDGGWMTTTLSEVRNRADVIVCAGTAAADFPRFFERCAPSAAQCPSQFGDLHRRFVFLGGCFSPTPGRSVDAGLAIPLANARLGEFCAALRARLAGRRLAADAVAGVPLGQLDALLDILRAARYGVLVWNAAELDFPHADLAIQAMVDLVKDLNRETRWSGLPLGGSDGGASAAQVCAWQAGYPLRTAFEAGGPRYEPQLFDGARLLAEREVDALLWIAALDPARTPPAADCPRIVLGRPDMTFTDVPDVFIPVAVPGVHQTGFMHRMDGVVALPLGGPVPSALPGVARALAAIQQEMSHAAA